MAKNRRNGNGNGNGNGNPNPNQTLTLEQINIELEQLLKRVQEAKEISGKPNKSLEGMLNRVRALRAAAYPQNNPQSLPAQKGQEVITFENFTRVYKAIEKRLADLEQQGKSGNIGVTNVQGEHQDFRANVGNQTKLSMLDDFIKHYSEEEAIRLRRDVVTQYSATIEQEEKRIQQETQFLDACGHIDIEKYDRYSEIIQAITDIENASQDYRQATSDTGRATALGKIKKARDILVKHGIDEASEIWDTQNNQIKIEVYNNLSIYKQKALTERQESETRIKQNIERCTPEQKSMLAAYLNAQPNDLLTKPIDDIVKAIKSIRIGKENREIQIQTLREKITQIGKNLPEEQHDTGANGQGTSGQPRKERGELDKEYMEKKLWERFWERKKFIFLHGRTKGVLGHIGSFFKAFSPAAGYAISEKRAQRRQQQRRESTFRTAMQVKENARQNHQSMTIQEARIQGEQQAEWEK